jgi:hypothetical protein
LTPAAITIATYTRSGGHWTLARKKRLQGTYFWKTVTAPRALCRLELSTAQRDGTGGQRLIVQRLVSPALGCGAPTPSDSRERR